MRMPAIRPLATTVYRSTAHTGPNNLEIGKAEGDEYWHLQWLLKHLKHPDFAGHYIMFFKGCGAGCRNGEIIDWQTGKIAFLPINELTTLKPYSFDPIAYCRNSSLGNIPWREQ